MAPRFSIIMPVYNASRTLAETVGSIVAQSGPMDWECILVEDSSTDNSPVLCDRLAEEYLWVRTLHVENRGPGAARNHGIEAARGEWLLFLDSDDLWPEDMLANLRLWLERYPAADWFAADHRDLTPEGVLTGPVHGWRQPREITGATFAERVSQFKAIGGMAVWQYCIRRRLVMESGVRFTPEIYWAEDTLFSLELLAKTEQVVFLPMTMLHYRCNRPGSLANSNLPRHIKGAADLWQVLEGKLTDPADRQAGREMAACVFWPDARAAASRDKALREACLPAMEQARPLYIRCDQSVGSPSWVLFRWLLVAFGPRTGLRMASLLHRK